MYIVVASILSFIVLAAIAISAAARTTRHFSANVERREVTGPDGRVRNDCSFSAWRANTLIGNTVGRVVIAFASARFDRQQRNGRHVERT